MTVVAPWIFFWGAFRFFNVLIQAVNRAWETKADSWWNLPLRNLILLGITGLTLLLGLAVPVIIRIVRDHLFSSADLVLWIYNAALLAGPLLVLFCGLILFYRLAPCRPTRFVEVWTASLIVAGLLCVLENIFGMYLRDFNHFNIVYGAFAGMMALLLWIYFSGCLIIFGACLSVAQARMNEHWWNKLGSKEKSRD